MTVDMPMPGSDGLTLPKQVRALSPAIYMILVTGDGRDEVRQGAAEIRVEQMQKPLTEEAIAALLSTLEQHHATLMAS